MVLPLPKVEELASVSAIDSLLALSAKAEEQHLLAKAEREKALGILARVLSITHADNKDFKPLNDCLESVKALQAVLKGLVGPQRHPEAEALVTDKHPLLSVLAVVEQRDALDDERWIALEDTVSSKFGKALWVAASRGKLVAREGAKTDKPAAPAPAPQAATPAAPPKPKETPVAAPAPVAEPAVAKPAPAAPAAMKAEAAPVAAVASAPAVTEPAPPPPVAAAPPAPAPVAQAPVAPAPVVVAPVAAAPVAAAPVAAAPPIAPVPQTRAQEPEAELQGAGKAGGPPDASGRPQRWGFWRGNR